MKRPVAVILVCAIAAGLSFKFLNRPADPLFKGTPTSKWVAGLLHPNGAEHMSVRELGASAAPLLAKHLPFTAIELLPPAALERSTRLKRSRATAIHRRELALGYLGDLGMNAAPALPQLIELLAEASADATVAEVNYVLRRIGPEAALALSAALSSRSEQLRTRVAQSLGDFAPSPPSLAALTKATRDRSTSVRANAAESLGDLKAAAESLAHLLTDRDAFVRAKACEAFGRIGSSSKDILPLLADNDATVRFEAARAAWRIDKDSDRVLSVLTDLLKTGESWRAAHVLAEMGDGAAPAVPALVTAMRREQVPRPFRAPASVTFALGQIDSAAPALAEALGDPQPIMRVNAAIALGFMGEAAAIAAPRLFEVLRDKNADVRLAAALTLGLIGSRDERTVAGLEEALRAEDIFLRSRALDLLRKIAPDREWAASSE